MGVLFSIGWGRPVLRACTVVHFEGLILGGLNTRDTKIFVCI